MGLAVSKYFSGEKDGRPGRVRSIIISWRRYELHLHHWLISSLAGAIITVEGSSLVIPELFYGFLGGSVFQGIYCYSDWYRIVKKKRYVDFGTEQVSLATENDSEAFHYYRLEPGVNIEKVPNLVNKL